MLSGLYVVVVEVVVQQRTGADRCSGSGVVGAVWCCACAWYAQTLLRALVPQLHVASERQRSDGASSLVYIAPNIVCVVSPTYCSR